MAGDVPEPSLTNRRYRLKEEVSWKLSEITARYISENARMNFMPAAFRGAFFSADHFIQSFLNRYAKDYQGGYWEYLQASNGAFFMEAPQPLWLSLPNYFEGECERAK